MLEIKRVSGREIIPYLSEIARLRIEIFRSFPYLYDGEEAYEREYLQAYTESGRSVVVLAIRDGEVVGASTGLPLMEADEAFRKPFAGAGIETAEIFYLGESVLKASERGQGIGHAFFDHRESHAAAHGFKVTAFCAVERATDHPQRPRGHRDNDTFWIKRGYTKLPHLAANLAWSQIDHPDGEVQNTLVFWVRTLQ